MELAILSVPLRVGQKVSDSLLEAHWVLVMELVILSVPRMVRR
jgi:hypothetical protein